MTTATTNPTRDVLTQQEAESRAARVSNVSYQLSISLTRGSPTYRGDVTIHFGDSGTGDLFLDLRGRTIETLTVNGADVAPNWTGYRLTLPGEALAPVNTVHLVYENEYDHTGDGLHQFVDPEDGQEYIYTNFEPYEAHRLFPCFDQPDIKATYDLSVETPGEWVVIANGRQTNTESRGDSRALHTFEKTKPFSTYLMAMVAGPYHAFHDEHNGLPLGLFCRESMVKHIDIDELFTLTKQGMDFFQEFFAYPYPFGKYDQVWVPEFNPGAMENVAAVTHHENYIFRDPPTENQRRTRAETVLHEMAHMWFGNLVTMKWWNDLWLNESFATYMSFLALTGATRFTDAWKAFNSDIKSWAYRQDQLVTTHPIAGTVDDTDQTFLNFDGITYGKGASVLKQLVAAIGLDAFREGMRRYFQRYQFGNATLDQFLDTLGEGAGRDLRAWAKVWLETPSLNTIGASWESDGARITQMSVSQTAPAEYPTLRPHHIEIGLIREDNGALTAEAIAADVDGAETEIPDARGKAAPQLVFPNYNDHAYAKIKLDDASVAYVRGNLDRITDPLLRQSLWSSLWDMVRDQQLTSTDFLALAGDKVRAEHDLSLVQSIIDRCLGALGRYVPDSKRDASFHAFFEVARAALQAAAAGDEQITWARALIGSAVTPDDLAYVTRIADGDITIAGLNLDQDMRWGIAVKNVGYGVPGARERIAAERERDPSDRGQRNQLRADAAEPSAEVKTAAWERFTTEGYGSLALNSAAMSGFHWYPQKDLLAPYTERFFADVRPVFEGHTKEYASAFFHNLFPGYRVEQAVLDRSERLLADTGDDNLLLTRMLREGNDDLVRAIKCRAFAEG